jgi:hypothetical protein
MWLAGAHSLLQYRLKLQTRQGTSHKHAHQLQPATVSHVCLFGVPPNPFYCMAPMQWLLRGNSVSALTCLPCSAANATSQIPCSMTLQLMATTLASTVIALRYYSVSADVITYRLHSRPTSKLLTCACQVL